MNEFDNVAEQFRLVAALDRLDRERAVQERQLIDAEGDGLWDDLLSAVKMAVEAINAKTPGLLQMRRLEQVGESERQEVVYNRRRLVLAYRRDSKTIQCSVGTDKDSLRVVADGDRARFEWSDGIRNSSADAATKALTRLLSPPL